MNNKSTKAKRATAWYKNNLTNYRHFVNTLLLNAKRE
jgi:hypothetical protein